MEGADGLGAWAGAGLALVEPGDDRREDLARGVAAPDQVAVAIIVDVPLGFAEPHDRLVGTAQPGEGQLGRRHVRHDVAVAGDQKRGCRDLAQHGRVINLAVGREHVAIPQIGRELAESPGPVSSSV